MGSIRSPRREAASARKKRHQELAAERRQHKELAAEARKATAGGGAGALVAKFRRRVATFDKTRSGDFEHLDKAARDIFLAADASAAAARALFALFATVAVTFGRRLRSSYASTNTAYSPTGTYECPFGGRAAMFGVRRSSPFSRLD